MASRLMSDVWYRDPIFDSVLETRTALVVCGLALIRLTSRVRTEYETRIKTKNNVIEQKQCVEGRKHP